MIIIIIKIIISMIIIKLIIVIIIMIIIIMITIVIIVIVDRNCLIKAILKERNTILSCFIHLRFKLED